MPTTYRYCKSDYPTPDCKKRKALSICNCRGFSFAIFLSYASPTASLLGVYKSDRRDSNPRHKLLGFLCVHITLYQLSYDPMESKSLATLARFTNAENTKKERKVTVTMNHDFYTYNAIPCGIQLRQFRRAGCGGWTCTIDLLGMNQASCYCSTPPKYEINVIIAKQIVKSQYIKNIFCTKRSKRIK